MVSENPTDKQSQPNDTQAKSSEKASAPQQLSSPAKIATKSDTPPTPHGYQITCKKEKDGWDRVKVWAEMLGLLVLVAYTTFAALQWCEMKKAVKAAQGANQIASDNLTISQRPWLGVDGIPTIVVPLKVNKLTEDQAKLDSSVAVSVKNFGNSPALGVGVHFNAMVTPRAVENNPADYLAALKAQADIACLMAESATRPLLPRDKEGGRYIFPNNPSRFEIASSNTGPYEGFTNPFQIVGCIVYADQFRKKIHHTRFCFVSKVSIERMTQADSLAACEYDEEAD